MRGYFEIGAVNTKRETNVGTLWRSAYQFGAAGIFLVGRRFERMSSDTTATYRHIPLREHVTTEDFLRALPFDAPLVAVETGGRDLLGFVHPERAVYVLGAEDYGLPKAILSASHHVISIPSTRTHSFNVAVAGSIVMFHRQTQFAEKPSFPDARLVARAGGVSE